MNQHRGSGLRPKILEQGFLKPEEHTTCCPEGFLTRPLQRNKIFTRRGKSDISLPWVSFLGEPVCAEVSICVPDMA